MLLAFTHLTGEMVSKLTSLPANWFGQMLKWDVVNAHAPQCNASGATSCVCCLHNQRPTLSPLLTCSCCVSKVCLCTALLTHHNMYAQKWWNITQLSAAGWWMKWTPCFHTHTHTHIKIIVVRPSVRYGRSAETIWPQHVRDRISSHRALEARTRKSLWAAVMALATGTNTSFLDILYKEQATMYTYM